MNDRKKGKKPPDRQGFVWTKRKRLAAQLVAEDQLTDEQIATKLEITPRCLYYWKRRPEFAADVERRVAEFDRVTRLRGISRVDRRVAAMDRRWRAMQQVISERAADPVMQGVAGGTTGLLIRREKVIGSGDAAKTVDEYELDAGLLQQLINHEKTAAVQLGQVVRRQEVSGDTDAPVVVKVLRGVSMDDI